MSQFNYQGPVSSASLRLDDGTPLEVTLHPGHVYDLPADHAYVRTLVARGFLVPRPEENVAPKRAAKAKTEGGEL